MNWARVGLNTRLRHDFAGLVPNDHWAQVTMQLTSQMGSPGTNPGTGTTPFFIATSIGEGLGAYSGCSPTPCWAWSDGHVQASPGPNPNTPYTVGYHCHPNGTGGFVFDWYINGVLVVTNPFVSSGFGAFNYMYLNWNAPFACCQVVYYSDVRVGTSQGGTDVFSDDFSSGNLDNWYVEAITTGYPLVANLVTAPADDVCPSLAASPLRAGPGESFTLTGSGFDPGSPITVYFTGGGSDSTPVEQAVVADGSGDFSQAMTVPMGIGNGANGNFPILSQVIAVDDLGEVGCAKFYVCGPTAADGIVAGWDNPTDQNPTNLPNPIVGLGGTHGTRSNPIYDYIFHDGAHWVLWADPSAIDNAGVFNPIPTNHSLNATRISADGSSVVDYPMDTPYQWIFDAKNVNDPGLFNQRDCCGTTVNAPVWVQDICFSSWSKPIIDAHFASDGTTLWIAVVTMQTVPFPWLDNLDARGINPGSAAQFVPLATLTSGFTSFWLGSGSPPAGYHRYFSNTVGPINIYKPQSYPTTDAGEKSSGYWSQPCVVIFAGGVGGFTQIGTVAAKYCPGLSEGPSIARGAGNLIGGVVAIQPSYRGALYSRVAIAASETHPGVAHVVWSEGGDWGRSGEESSCCQLRMWDGGPENRSYRVNYTTWSPSAKLTDQELWESHIDRTSWFVFANWSGTSANSGYSWPDQADFAALLNFDVRCDNANGDVLLFCATPQSINDPTIPTSPGYPTPNYDNAIIFGDTLHVYEISGGSPVLLHSITPDLFPDEMETSQAWPLGSSSNQPNAAPVETASDCMYVGPYPYTGSFLYNITSISPQPRGFGISRIYEDPLLGGTPVYLVHVPWARRYPDRLSAGYGNWHMRGFYRIPADMSGGFEFLDGDRQLGFTVYGGRTNLSNDGASIFDSGDILSDPKNIWIPAPTGPQNPGGSGVDGYWFDRVCDNAWKALRQAETPSDYTDNFGSLAGLWPGHAICPGFYYDAAGDTLSYVCGVTNPLYATAIFAVQQLHFCRGCRSCACGVGVHLSHRF